MSAGWFVVVALIAGACASPAKRSARPASTLEADRGELVLTTQDGRELRSADLIGAILEVGDSVVRLDAVQRDPIARDRVLLHHFTVISQGGPPSELCTADAAGQRWAMAIQDERGQVQLVCSSGAIGKCIRWGYPPIRHSSHEHGVRTLHDACVRMVRADYGGDGATATRDGTLIGFCDLAGVRPCTGSETIEAAWFEGGAACVARPRIPDLASLEELADRYPRLVGHLGSACTIAAEMADTRVMLFDWVVQQPRRQSNAD